jgi:hypothetical protein
VGPTVPDGPTQRVALALSLAGSALVALATCLWGVRGC